MASTCTCIQNVKDKLKQHVEGHGQKLVSITMANTAYMLSSSETKTYQTVEVVVEGKKKPMKEGMAVNIKHQILFIGDAVELLNKKNSNEITLTERNIGMLKSIHDSLLLLSINRDKISEGNDYNFPELYNIATNKLT